MAKPPRHGIHVAAGPENVRPMTTDYKSTLNLPRTGFAMKAGLVEREPLRLRQWEQVQLYRQIQARRAGAPRFVLHDGPPFANGDVHIGNALNKILKDIIVRYHSLRGQDAPFVPGWDCHGLPIEFKVTQEMRKAGQSAAGPADIRKACEASARKFIDVQRTQFKRLGVLGDWENPYLTLDKAYEADELRLLADLIEKGFIYRGKKPVYWSIPARTALAEAEVEYHDHTSRSIYVKFPVEGEPGTFVLIWTTTPWTLPANLAVAYNSTLTYWLVRVGDGAILGALLPGALGGGKVPLDGAADGAHGAWKRTGLLALSPSFLPAVGTAPGRRRFCRKLRPARALFISRPGTDWRTTDWDGSMGCRFIRRWMTTDVFAGRTTCRKRSRCRPR